MPRASRICAKQGCGEIADQGNYCTPHTLPQNNWGNSKRERVPGWAKLRTHVMWRDKNTCQTCGKPAQEVDHIIPLSRGGNSKPDNLQALCKACNASKNYKERKQ